MKFLHRLLLFCGLLVFLPGGVLAEDIVIGMSAAFTGPSRGLGIELYRGSMAYIEHINQSGGVSGRKIVIKAYDDGYNPISAIQNTIRFMEQDKVFLLFDYVGTPTVTRVLPLLKSYRVRPMFLFFPFTGAQPQRQPPYNAYVFNLRASYQEEAEGLVDNFVLVGRRRIGVFYQSDAYGRSGWDGIRRALAKNGGLKIAQEATYRRGTAYSETLKDQVEILRSAAPDAIISVGAYEACAGFIRDARNAGWRIPIANVSFVGSESLAALLAESSRAAKKDYTQDLINSQVVPSYEDTSLSSVREYRELIDKYNPLPPHNLIDQNYKPLRYSFVSLEGFLNAKLLVGILKRMGENVTSSRIKEVTERIKNLDLGMGTPISFGPDKHQGSEKIYYTTLSDGRFVPITDWGRWRQ
jgi:branched-chain amino acid transport system substrate-binding protein